MNDLTPAATDAKFVIPANPGLSPMDYAKLLFDAGMPREIWAAFVCDARGVDHGLPQTTFALRAAQEADIAATRAALGWSNNKAND